MSSCAEAAREKNCAALFSLLAAVVLTACKLAVGLMTNSLGILSEALHSGLDILAAGMTLLAVRMAASPADGDHAYGHAKMENLAALAETLLLLAAAVWILHGVAERLFWVSVPVTPSLWGVGVMLFSIVVDVGRAVSLRRVARKHQSRALEADALHFLSDIWSSAAVLAGVCAGYGAQWLPPSPLRGILENADALAAALVAVVILHACWHLLRQSVHELLDGGSGELRTQLENLLSTLPGVNEVRRVRVRSSGAAHFVDFTLCVDPYLQIEEAHSITEAAERATRQLFPGADVTVHVESALSEEANPMRLIQNAAAVQRLRIHNLQLFVAENGLRAELHVELPAEMTLTQARRKVRALETALHELLPRMELLIHLEPEGRADGTPTCTVTSYEEEAVKYTLEQAWQECPEILDCHKLLLYRDQKAGQDILSLSLHCCLPGDTRVREVHASSLRLERALRQRLPGLGNILIHMEPFPDGEEIPAACAPESPDKAGG